MEVFGGVFCCFVLGFFFVHMSFGHVLVSIVQCQKSLSGVLLMEDSMKRQLRIGLGLTNLQKLKLEAYSDGFQ